MTTRLRFDPGRATFDDLFSFLLSFRSTMLFFMHDDDDDAGPLLIMNHHHEDAAD